MTRRAALILICFWTGAGVATAAAAPQDQARRILADLGAQTALPDGPKAPPPAQTVDLRRWIVPPDLARAILWAAALLGLGGIAWSLRGRLPRLGRRPAEAGPNALPAPPPPVDTPLGDADALARSGRFVEAMHVLLLRCLADLRTRLGTLPPALTSREILQRIRLAPEAEAALRTLVDHVEHGRFGGRAVTAADYEAGRASASAFCARLHAGAPEA